MPLNKARRARRPNQSNRLDISRLFRHNAGSFDTRRYFSSRGQFIADARSIVTNAQAVNQLGTPLYRMAADLGTTIEAEITKLLDAWPADEE